MGVGLRAREAVGRGRRVLCGVSVASSADVERVLLMNEIIYCAADILEVSAKLLTTSS